VKLSELLFSQVRISTAWSYCYHLQGCSVVTNNYSYYKYLATSSFVFVK